MSLREEWKFEYTTQEVFNASKAKIDYHTARLDFWTKKREEVIENIKKDGLEISESVAGSIYQTSTSQRNPQMVVNPVYQTDLNECSQKMEHHKNKLQGFSNWFIVLQKNPDATLQLEIEDVLFFFGK